MKIESAVKDSLEENLPHKRTVSYPGNKTLTADFVVGEYWIEFFGLYGQHKRYDELRNEKLQLVKGYHLKFVAIYPKNLFPKNTLASILSFIVH